MLIEEITTGSIPKHLKLTLSSLEKPDINDYVVVLLYTLMIETGFIPVGVQNTTEDISPCYGFNALNLSTYSKLPNGWKNEKGNSYEIKFQIGSYAGHSCQLLVLLMQDLLVIDLFIEKQTGSDDNTFVSCFTMTVCPSMHVTTVNSSPVPTVEYTDIQKLAHKFKDTIASPARASILTDCGLTNPSLMGLPEEITLNIFRYLKLKEIGTVSQVCTFLNELCKDQHLWYYMYKRDCIPAATQNNATNWAALYKQYHIAQATVLHAALKRASLRHSANQHQELSRIDFPELGIFAQYPLFNFSRYKRCRRNNP